MAAMSVSPDRDCRMPPQSRRTGLEQLQGRRIAIIKPSALGDVVQSLPLLPALRRRFPEAHLTWVIQRELRELVTDHPALDAVIAVDRRPDLQSALQTLSGLRAARFDVVIDLQGLLRSALMTLATGARWRVGLETAREGAAWSTNLVIPGTGRDVPAHARYWRVAEALGYGEIAREAWLTVPQSALAEMQQRIENLPRPLLAVQWGAKWETKRWPLTGFADVLSHAVQGWNCGVVIVGGGGERSDCQWLTDEVIRRTGSPHVRNLAGQTTIKQLAALLSLVDFAVCNDSGPLHLAAELGKPTLGIFTCTSAVRSGPPGDQHELVSTRLPCAASYKKVCPHSGSQHMACHQELTSARVRAALGRLLERSGYQQLKTPVAA